MRRGHRGHRGTRCSACEGISLVNDLTAPVNGFVAYMDNTSACNDIVPDNGSTVRINGTSHLSSHYQLSPGACNPTFTLNFASSVDQQRNSSAINSSFPTGRRPQHFISSVPTYSLSVAQKRSLKAQSQRLKPSPVDSPTTSHFQLQHPTSIHLRSTPFSSKQRHSFLPPSFHQIENTGNERSGTPLSRVAPPIGHEGFMSSLTPHPPYSQPCQDERRPSKEPLSPTTTDNVVHNGPQTIPLITSLKSNFPQKCKKGSDEAFMPPDATTAPQRFQAPQRFHDSTSAHTSNVGQGLLAQGQLGKLKDSVKVVETSEQVTGDVEVVDQGPGFAMAPSSPSSPSMVPESTSTTPSEISPMGQLMAEYSSTETSVMLVLSLGELTLDLIVDRGENRTRGLRRYHLLETTLDNICMVVRAQQTFVQQAASLMVEGKAQFIVDPRDTLIPILQGTNSLPQLYVAWKALMARMRLGVKTWGKYVAEYHLQVGAHC